jgi:hypothetical protein
MAFSDPIDQPNKLQEDNSFILSICPCRIHLYDSSPEPWGLKDLQSRYIYVNKAYLALLDLPEDTDVQGKTFADLTGDTGKFSDSIRMHELLVIEKQHAVYSREVREFGHDHTVSPYVFKRMPYFSHDGQIVAIEFNGMPWDALAFLNSNYPILLSQKVAAKPTKPTLVLNEQEWEILYLYCLGVKRKELAFRFGESEVWMKHALKNISLKLNLDSQSELLSYVIKEGWINHIPVNLLKNFQSFIVMPSFSLS